MPEANQTALLLEMWNQLRLAPTKTAPGNVPVLPLDIPTGPNAWASVLPTGEVALLIESAGPGESSVPGHAKHIRQSERTLQFRGTELEILQLECPSEPLEPMFAEVCAMILTRTATGTPVRPAVEAVLRELSELLGLGATEGPRPARTDIGLIGELLVLRDLVERSPKHLNTWTGPSGSRFDFRAGLFALEVKTLLKKQTESVTISSMSQLEAPVGGTLWLHTIILEPDPLGELSITRLHQAIRHRMPASQALQLDAHLKDTLDALKVSEVPEKNYALQTRHLYETGPGFPALTEAHLTAGTLPVGISHVTYRLDLAAAADWKSELSLSELIATELELDDDASA